jgi:hypothetical protein
MWGRLVACAAVGYRRNPDAGATVGRLPFGRRFVNPSAWPVGMALRATKGDEKPVGFREISMKLGKAGRGASRGPGGPPYFGRFSVVPHKSAPRDSAHSALGSDPVRG